MAPIHNIRSAAIRTLSENHNVSLPGSGVNFLAASLSIDSKISAISYQFTPTVAGVLSIVVISGTSTTAHKQAGGATLTAEVSYPGEFMVPSSATFNFRYTGSSTGYYDLIVREI